MNTNKEQIFLPKKFDCPTLISFSGGRTSGYMLYKILEAYDYDLPEDVYITFCNTGKEMPETLDFVHDCEKNWGCKIHWLELDIHEERPIYRTKEVTYETASRNGEPFEALINRKNVLPNPAMRICTVELKINVMKRFMQDKGHTEWANVVGLRYDEPRRVASQRRANDKGINKWESLVPLYDAKIMVQDVAEFWEKNHFDLKLPNFGGKTPAGNCDLCYLKGTQTLVQLLREKPELADWWIQQEENVRKAQMKKNDLTEEQSYQLATAKWRNNRDYIKLIEIAEDEKKQVTLFDDDGRSCFCHD